MFKYLAIGIVVLTIAAEAALRWSVGMGDPPLARLDPATEYELVPSATYQRWGNTIAINSHGMRGPEHAQQPAGDAQHLLLIGDSVVYGGHFLEQSQIISAQMGDMFAADPRFATCPVLVLPMAVSSWGPVNQAAALQKYGTFGASAAAIVVSSHDLYDLPSTTSDILPYRTSRSLTAIGDLVRAVWERLQRPAPAIEDEIPFPEKAALSIAALDQMAEKMAVESIPFVLIYHPTISERLGQPHPERASFQEWAEARDTPFFDLGSMQVAADDYRDNIHPAASGAQRIAQTLVPVMAELVPPCAGN